MKVLNTASQKIQSTLWRQYYVKPDKATIMCYTDLEKLQHTFDSTVCPETLSSEIPCVSLLKLKMVAGLQATHTTEFKET